jgi:heme A synthase
MLLIQATLGITTLLLVVPVPLAALHQAGAVLLFAAAINAAHTLRPRVKEGGDLHSAASGAMIDLPPRIQRRV